MKIRDEKEEGDHDSNIVQYENFIHEKWVKLNKALSPNTGGFLGTVLWVLSRLLLVVIAIILSPFLVIGLFLAMLAVG